MKKLVLVILGILFSFLCLEIGLQTAGILLKTIRKYKTDYVTNTYDSIKNKDLITIMCIGESTTEEQYTLFLGEYLTKYIPDKNFNIIDSGYGAIRLDDLYYKVQTNIEKYNPDIIVGMIGINNTTEYIFKILSSKLKTLRVLKLIYSSYNKQNISNDIDIEDEYHPADEFYHEIINSQKANDIKTKLYNALFIDSNKSKSSLLVLLSETTKAEAVHIYGMKNECFRFLLSQYYDNYAYGNISFDTLIENIMKENEVKKEFKYGLNGILCMMKSDYVKGLKNLDMADAVRLTYDYTDISKKYKKILDLIIKKNIKYIAMQYPVRDVGSLKKIIEATGYENDVIFVSNKENFRKDLMSDRKKYIFADLFAWDFGHCTEFGNRLIADNLAKEISKILK
jgi:hypothetical protein